MKTMQIRAAERLVQSLAVATLIFSTTGYSTALAAEPERWITVPNSSLEVEEGSALDLSRLSVRRNPDDTRRIGVQPGSEAFTVDGTPDPDMRFFCANMVFGWNTARFPPIEEAVRWAQMVKHGGYNAVRIHLPELTLMENRRGDFNFDPVQLERFDHLLAALRAEGIYFVFDMMGSWNGAYGDIDRNRWVEGIHDTKAGSYVEGADRDHWLALVQLLWARPNPLTGIAPLKDPATAGVILVNEGEIDFISRKGTVAPAIVNRFEDWAMTRYGSQAGIVRAWGRPFGSAVFYGQNADLEAAEDFRIFSTELQLEQVAWMTKALRDLGYTGMFSNFNTLSTFHNAASRQALSFVDTHSYSDFMVNGMVEPGATIYGGTLLNGKNRYLDLLSWSRLEGKPFTVTEYGMPAWNRERYAVAPMTAAYARLQDWKMICHYGTPVALSRPSRGVWQQMIVPYNVGQDPTLRAGETIAAFLFGRGDVSASDTRIVMELSPEEAASAPANQSINWFTAKVQHIFGVATRLRGDPVPPIDAAKRFIVPFEKNGSRAHQLLSGPEAKNIPTAATGPFISSTGELNFDAKAERFSVVSKGSIGVVSNGPAQVEGNGWSLSLASGAGAVFLSDLGKGDLVNTQNALLVISTDSRNSGMTFSDKEEKVLDKIGIFPVKIRDAEINITFSKRDTGLGWKLYALDFTGRRQKELVVTSGEDGRLSANVKLSELDKEITTYFELVAVKSL